MLIASFNIIINLFNKLLLLSSYTLGLYVTRRELNFKGKFSIPFKITPN